MGGGHDHHGPPMPPMARMRPPTKTLPEEVELVWNDGVAPECAVDIDARHIPTGRMVKHFLTGLGFFASTFLVIYISDPASRAPIAPRSAVLNEKAFLVDIGLAPESDLEEQH
eukprot:gene10642-11798_t